MLNPWGPTQAGALLTGSQWSSLAWPSLCGLFRMSTVVTVWRAPMMNSLPKASTPEHPKEGSCRAWKHRDCYSNSPSWLKEAFLIYSTLSPDDHRQNTSMTALPTPSLQKAAGSFYSEPQLLLRAAASHISDWATNRLRASLVCREDKLDQFAFSRWNNHWRLDRLLILAQSSQEAF